MKANVGDWLVIKGTTTGARTSGGLLRRWTPRTARPLTWCGGSHRPCGDVVTGPDAIVVTPEEQEAADEGARNRPTPRRQRLGDAVAVSPNRKAASCPT